MITGSDFYHVMMAMVPLYVAMILGYCSVRWWRIFTPDQCSGINRFVSIFCVPLLTFHFTSTNNPYTINLRFIAADMLQKVMVLAMLSAWSHLSCQGSLEWAITLFSLSTLPDMLVMGIPLLTGMYGDILGGSLVVPILVLQCIIWNMLMLFMLEYHTGWVVINEVDPYMAGAIASIVVDPDMVNEDGTIHITVRRSNVSRSDIYSQHRSSMGVSSSSTTTRPSNLTNAELRSSSSRNPTPPAGSSFNHNDRSPNLGPADPFGIRSGATPRPSKHKCRLPVVNEDLQMFVGCSRASLVTDVSGGAAQDYNNAVNNGANDWDELSFRNEETVAAAGGSPNAVATSTGPMLPTNIPTGFIPIMVCRKLIRNPNSYSILIGLIWSLVCFRWNLEMPAIVLKSFSFLSDAGPGMAMFGLGLFLALRPQIITCGNKVAAFAMALRFLIGPAVMAAASFAVGLRGTLLRVAIVQAAMPQGVVPFVMAKEYNVHPDILSTALVLSLLIAPPITLVYYILLGL